MSNAAIHNKQPRSLDRQLAWPRWFVRALMIFVVAIVVYYLNQSAIKDRAVRSPPAPVAKRWSRFTWPEVGIEVIMPEGAQQQQLGNLPADPLRERVAYASTADAMTYFLTCTDYSRDVTMSESDDDLLANAPRWLGAGRDARVERISLAGHQGVEIDRLSQTADGHRVRNRTRWFLKGRRAIILGVTGKENEFDETGATRFLESLQFVGDDRK